MDTTATIITLLNVPAWVAAISGILWEEHVDTKLMSIARLFAEHKNDILVSGKQVYIPGVLLKRGNITKGGIWADNSAKKVDGWEPLEISNEPIDLVLPHTRTYLSRFYLCGQSYTWEFSEACKLSALSSWLEIAMGRSDEPYSTGYAAYRKAFAAYVETGEFTVTINTGKVVYEVYYTTDELRVTVE